MICKISVVLGLSICGFRFARACTSIAIGAKASADGSVIIGQSEDGDDAADPRLIYVPARDFEPGAMAPSYYSDGPFPRWVSEELGPGYMPNDITGPNLTTPIGYIPQVSHTFAYWSANYAFINEHNVAIQETTCSAMFKTCGKGDTRGCEPGRTIGEALLDMRMLTFFGLERATTAREAVQIMGDLAYTYGFYGTHDGNGHGESVMVGDKQEAWVFHILADPTGTKAIWASVRVPDDSVTVAANMFTLREINVNDTANCLASPNIYSVAESYGWWKPGDVLDFTKVYSNGEYGNKFYSGRRMWRILSLSAPSMNIDPDYDDLRYDRKWPWAVKPDTPITLQNVFGWYRDWYAGTPFDLTKGLAAGYGGTPDRFGNKDGAISGGWERSIALYRTQTIKVAHIQAESADLPKEVAGVAWVSPGPAHYSPFLPVPSGLTTQLLPLSKTTPYTYSRRSLNWQTRKVMTAAQARFDHMHPLVQAKQRHVEDDGLNVVSSVRNKLLHGHSMSSACEDFVAHTGNVLETWQDLPDEMLVRFSFNSDLSQISVTQRDVGQEYTQGAFGYPNSWLRAVGYADHPLPPVETQCPPFCGKSKDQETEQSVGAPDELAATVRVGEHVQNFLFLFGIVAATLATILAAVVGQRFFFAKRAPAHDTRQAMLYNQF